MKGIFNEIIKKISDTNEMLTDKSCNIIGKIW